MIVARAPLPRILAFADDRGWRRLRLLSAADNTFKRDFHSQTPDGQQTPVVNVFQRDSDGIRHFWSSEMWYAPSDPGQDPRHTGTIEPLFNLLDLTRGGRSPTWQEQLNYA